MDWCLATIPWFLSPEFLFGTAMAFIGLGFVIFVHELGHFLVAKACGVKCEKFYVGFDPPIRIGPIKLPPALWKRKWGETEYGIGIIPLGGYVKMLGQDDNPANAEAEAERTKVRTEDGQGEEVVAVDPRSYTAKSVPKRMAIISAGVIMNLIFAVIFAVIAYMMGVSYTPAEVRRTIAGDPAWMAGLQPGDKILQIGRDGRRDEQLRFAKDLRIRLVMSGAGKDIDLLIRRAGESEPQWVTLRPTDSMKKETKNPATIGITGPMEAQLASGLPVVPGSAASRANPALAGGDRIVAVDGEPIDWQMGYQLEQRLAQCPDRTVKLSISRVPTTETDSGVDPPRQQLEVEVPRQRMAHLGVTMEMGPIVAVQPGSIADEAGLKAGDRIVQLDGQPVGDPMRLPERLRVLAGKSVELQVERGDGEQAKSVTVLLTPRLPTMIAEPIRNSAPVGVEAIGVAFTVDHRVSGVDATGPAHDKLAVGDRILKAKVILPKLDEEQAKGFPKKGAEVEFDDESRGWPNFMRFIQHLPQKTQVELTFQRGQKEESTTIEVAEATDWFNATRGMITTGREEIRRAESFGEAVSLGWRETWESAGQVVVILRRIREMHGSLGGPGTILFVAGKEASAGLPRLLVFLTLLSANLAVINFLPIPVLDGGHMVFLAVEGIRGKPVDERLQIRLTIVGLSLILALMVYVIGLDIQRFLPFLTG